MKRSQVQGGEVLPLSTGTWHLPGAVNALGFGLTEEGLGILREIVRLQVGIS